MTAILHSPDRPASAGAGVVDLIAPIETPIGRLFVAGHGATVTAVGRSLAGVEASLCARFGRPSARVAALPEPLGRAVAVQLQGTATTALAFDLGDWPDFDQAVLRTALTIPRGQVRSYAWVAQAIGLLARGARDVGQALGRNPIPLLIPCHRVVRSDGSLGGYGLGGRAKQTLLRAEGYEPPAETRRQSVAVRAAVRAGQQSLLADD